MLSTVAAPPVVGCLVHAGFVQARTDNADKDKPKPMLGSIPPEILEMIVGSAMGDSVTINMSFSYGRWRGHVTWSPQWVPSILLVSKNIRRVVQSALQRLSTDLTVTRPRKSAWMALPLHLCPAHRVAVRHFKQLVGKEPDRVHELKERWE
jgi:hypothetical protein